MSETMTPGEWIRIYESSGEMPPAGLLLKHLDEHDAEDARLRAEKAALGQALLVAHEYCCDDFEVPCTPENCQIQQALDGDARAIDRLTRGSSVAALANQEREIETLRAALRQCVEALEEIAARCETGFSLVEQKYAKIARAALAVARAAIGYNEESRDS